MSELASDQISMVVPTTPTATDRSAELAERRAVYNGFGDSLARAVELTVTPAVFGFLGWLLDGLLSTRPLFTVIFTLGVFGYVVWKLWAGYEASMRAHEQHLGLRSRSRSAERDGHR